MRCPACDAQIKDQEAAFCARCGSALARGEGKATTPIDHEEIETAGSRSSSAGGPTSALHVAELTTALRGALLRGGWLDASTGAVAAFLASLCVGIVLLLAAKLQFPELGAGASPLSVLNAIVIVTLGSMGASVSVGGLEVHAIPLGLLAGIGVAIAWAASAVVARRDAPGLRSKAVEGARIALPFASICWLAALIFQIRGGENPVSVSAFEALLLGALWGALFGALGGLRRAAPIRELMAAATAALARRRPAARGGVAAAATMLVASALLTGAVALLWVIVALARGDIPEGFSVSDAVAALVYAVAFLPNILVAVLTLAFGGSVTVGAQITIAGEVVGPLHSYSLFGWAGAPTPWPMFGLVLIPVSACLLGGFVARRTTRAPSEIVESLGVGAGMFATAVLLAGVVGTARLGAGIVHERGFGVVAPDAGVGFVLALLWASIVGFAGWKLAETQQEPS